VVELDVLTRLVLVGHLGDVLKDLLAAGIVRRPIWIVLEEEREAGRRDVACHAGIAVLQPYTADI
jgi:hypothetical protein